LTKEPFEQKSTLNQRAIQNLLLQRPVSNELCGS